MASLSPGGSGGCSQNPQELYGEAVSAVYALAAAASESEASLSSALAQRDEIWKKHLDKVIAAERANLLRWHAEVLESAMKERDEIQARQAESKDREVERLHDSQQRCLDETAKTKRLLEQLKNELVLEQATAHALAQALLCQESYQVIDDEEEEEEAPPLIHLATASWSAIENEPNLSPPKLIAAATTTTIAIGTEQQQEEDDENVEALPPPILLSSRQRRSSVDAKSKPRAWSIDDEDEALITLAINSTDETFAEKARKEVLRFALETRRTQLSTTSHDGTRVKVIARIRPVDTSEKVDVIQVVDNKKENIIVVNDPYIADLRTPFTLDGVIDSRNGGLDNADVFYAVGVEAAAAVLNGTNATIFCYGQTGSGKTHTLLGGNGDAGLASRITAAIFDALVYLPSPSEDVSIPIDAAFVEIYQDKIRDLLADNEDSLKLREHPEQGVYVEGVTRWEMTSGSDVDELLAVGSCRRQTGSSPYNADSSRSHAALVFTVGPAQLTCVDLAGSERALDTSPKSHHKKKQAARKKHLKESCAINTSLSTLGRCVAYLANAGNNSPQAKIAGGLAPFRDSPLTWFLREALCGDSRTWMIACINPCHHFESLSTLRYAATARALRTRPAADHNNDQNPLQTELKRLKSQNADLRRKLSDAIRHLQHQKHIASRRLEDNVSSWPIVHTPNVSTPTSPF